MTSATELKPCPFCGGEAFFREAMIAFSDCEVSCDCCGFSGPNYGGLNEFGFDVNKAHAAQHWNTRAPQWQPIEAAPKDGTKVLVYSPFFEESFACIFDVGMWQLGVWTANYKKTEPTHWMPLPEGPAT